jgi:hypothetical protein
VSTTEIYYVCPQCGRTSTDPQVTITHDYTPKPGEHQARPDRLGVGDQHLHCPCSHIYTWFSARQVTVRDRT